MISLRPVPVDAEIRPRYYDVSIVKLIVFWMVSFGLYGLYWHYKHWSAENDHGGGVTPWARALFSPFFAYSLFKRIKGQCEARDVAASWSAGLLALMYFIGMSSFRLQDVYWTVGYLAFLPLIPVQLSANALNRVVAPDTPPNTSFSYVQLLLSLIGLVLFMLSMLGTFGPAAAVR